MAIASRIFYSDGYFALDLYPGEARERIEADPPVEHFNPDSPVWFEWDGEKLDRGEYEFLGVTVIDLDLLTEGAIAEAERVPAPRVDSPEVGLFDARLGDVLRWAKRTYPGRRVGIATQPAVSTPVA